MGESTRRERALVLAVESRTEDAMTGLVVFSLAGVKTLLTETRVGVEVFFPNLWTLSGRVLNGVGLRFEVNKQSYIVNMPDAGLRWVGLCRKA